MKLFHEGFPVAEVRAEGGLHMVYDPTWLARPSAFPVSLTMPLGQERVSAARLMPWLANLLPESHLAEMAQHLKVPPQNVLAILTSVGRDTAGGLSIALPRNPGNHYREVAAAGLEQILDKLPSKPFLIGELGVSMSLAGTQAKLPVLFDAGRISIPLNGSPSTHIIKPDSAGLPGIVQNEAFCMTLAGLVGLDVARVSTGIAGHRTYLIVERYDRVRTNQGFRRLHQEDFCQLLGFLPASKYEKDASVGTRGPSLAMMFEALKAYISAGERLRLLDAVIFNVLISNTDSHSKNYAVQIGANGSARLAPLYDLLCTSIYPAVETLLPQKIGERWYPADLNALDWQQLAREAGLSPSKTLVRVRELCAAVEVKASEAVQRVAAMPAGDHEILRRMLHKTKERCRRIRRQVGSATGEG